MIFIHFDTCVDYSAVQPAAFPNEFYYYVTLRQYNMKITFKGTKLSLSMHLVYEKLHGDRLTRKMLSIFWQTQLF